MNHRPLLLYAATSALTFAQDKPAADPRQLAAAREENIRATQRALVPVLQSNVTKLTGLKQQPFAPSFPSCAWECPLERSCALQVGVSAGESATPPPADTPSLRRATSPSLAFPSAAWERGAGGAERGTVERFHSKISFNQPRMTP